jgi:hypothetical protein
VVRIRGEVEHLDARNPPDRSGDRIDGSRVASFREVRNALDDLLQFPTSLCYPVGTSMADNIAYPGNPGLPKEVREKILSTFRHSLNLYKAGKGEDSRSAANSS